MNATLLSVLRLMPVLVLAGCDRKAPISSTPRDAAWDGAVSNLAVRTRSEIAWESRIPERRSDSPFSVDLSRAMIRDQPVILDINLTDVSERGEGFLISGSCNVSNSFELRAELSCTKEQVAVFLREENFSEFAVAAQITNVSRRVIKVQTETFSEQTGPEIIIMNDPAAFIAKGTFIDALKKP